MADTFLKPMTSGFLHESNESYIFISASHIEGELDVLLAALPPSAEVETGTAPEQESLIEIAAWILDNAPFVLPANVGEIRRVFSQLTNSQILQIRSRLYQLRRALVAASQISGKDFGRTDTFAVSPAWNRRWSDLLMGRLFPAYIGYVYAGDIQP